VATEREGDKETKRCVPAHEPIYMAEGVPMPLDCCGCPTERAERSRHLRSHTSRSPGDRQSKRAKASNPKRKPHSS
jgi:hypothetical protein